MTMGRDGKSFLPMSRHEMQRLGWDVCDVIMLTGDAYIDHPSYGVAVIARLLESCGLRVGVIAQPNPNRLTDFSQLGRPRMFFGVTSGCADSMINNYSPTKRPRKFDNYSAGRLTGRRPDHAVVVYGQALKQVFPETPVILGGIEAGLRRLAHYDYFDDAVLAGTLTGSGADLLVYGQGEKAVRDIVKCFRHGTGIEGCRGVRGVAWRAAPEDHLDKVVGKDRIDLPDYDDVVRDKDAFLRMAKSDLSNFDPWHAKPMTQRYADHVLVVNPPQPPMTTQELDAVYELPFVRTPHPRYKKQGAIPAFETVKFSLMTHRGCHAGCSFCAIFAHQGRFVTSRSEGNVLGEARLVSKFRYFRGVVSNIGGPVGNVYGTRCAKQEPGAEEANRDACARASCTYPEPCRNLNTTQRPYLNLLREALKIDGVKQAFIASNFRYDLIENDPDGEELFLLILSRFTGGMFKPAPMHVSDAVMRRLRKYAADQTPRFFDKCVATFKKLGRSGVEIVPYVMASHPGSTMEDALEVAQFMRERGIESTQIQDFVPMPGTASACMHYTGVDPLTDEKVYRPLAHRERKLQRALLQYRRPDNARFVREALTVAGRTDLIGDGPGCLVPAAGPGDEGA
ncbi:MAG: YgiQ family radical SAM protein [Deltaproteobacteria bacterium]|nr:YgiQ family radical SAM protein [Deltaproteobacteria bacterium]